MHLFRIISTLIAIIIIGISSSFALTPHEIMIHNERFSFWSQKFEEFENLSIKHDQLIKDFALQLNRTKDELKATKNDSKETKDEFKDTKNDLKMTKDELKMIKDEAKVTNNKLKEMKDELKVTKEELKVTKEELKVTNDELKFAKDKLKEMKDEVEVSNKKLNFTEFRVNDIKSAIENCACARTAEQVYNAIIKPKLQMHRRVGDYYKEKPDFTWIINNVSHLSFNSWPGVKSPIFPSTNASWSVQFYLDSSGDRDLAAIKVNYTALMEIRPRPVVYCTVKDGSGNGKDRLLSFGFSYINPGYVRLKPRHPSPRVRHTMMRDYTFYIGQLNRTASPSNPYVIDDTSTIDIHVEPPEVAQLVYSYDGKLTWAVDNYRRVKESQAENLVGACTSPYFYASAGGPRLQVSAQLNGHPRYGNKGLTMTVHVLGAVFFFNHTASVTLFNPIDSARNVSKCVAVDVEKPLSYSIEMGGGGVAIEKLLFNDTLYYEVIIRGSSNNDETEVECSGDKFWSESRHLLY